MIGTLKDPVGGMILCAGYGTRMRPLTETTPKPLIEVHGKPLADYAMEKLISIGAQPIVVNAHYLAEQIFSWANSHSRANIIISNERETLLDTGGGVVKAAKHFHGNRFFVLNSDAFWIDLPGHDTLIEMSDMFERKDADFIMLLARHKNAIGFDGPGDFFCNDTSQLTRRGTAQKAPFIYAGCYLINPRILKGAPEGPFSMNLLWDKALASGRVYGHIHGGLWLHVGTPEAIAEAEQAIENFDKQP